MSVDNFGLEFCNPSLDQLIATFATNEVDFCSNYLVRTYPRGLDCQVFPTAVLAQVAELTHDAADREHMGLYIYEHPERFRLLNVASGLPPEVGDLRLTVDTPEDLRLIEKIFTALYPSNPLFKLADILDLFHRSPELRRLNQRVQQKPIR